jgi:hypothetical protein
MADNIEFVDGLIVKAPNPKAPDFVKASISIKVADLGVWLRAKHKAGEEWVNIDVKESKAGKWYAAVSTYKPKSKDEEKPAGKPEGKFDDLDSDIPFSPLRKLESSVL